MYRKLNKSQGYFYLTSKTQPRIPAGCVDPDGWQTFDPGQMGTVLRQKTSELAKTGLMNCFIVTDMSLKRSLIQQLPFWIRQLKMDYPQLDFHLSSGRRV